MPKTSNIHTKLAMPLRTTTTTEASISPVPGSRSLPSSGPVSPLAWDSSSSSWLRSASSSSSAGAERGPSGTGQPGTLSCSQLLRPGLPPYSPKLLDSRIMPPPPLSPSALLSPPCLLLRPRPPCPPQFRRLSQAQVSPPLPPSPSFPRPRAPQFMVRGHSALLLARHLLDMSGGECLWAGALSPSRPPSRDLTQFPLLPSGRTGCSARPQSGPRGSPTTTASPGSSTGGPLPGGTSSERLLPPLPPGTPREGSVA